MAEGEVPWSVAGNGVLNLTVLKMKAHQTNVQHQNQTSMCRLNVSSG